MFIGVSSLVYRLVIEGDLKLKTPKTLFSVYPFA